MPRLSTTMTVRLPVELKARLDRLAATTARSRSWLAADAIASYVEEQEWQLAEIASGLREADSGELAAENEAEAVLGKIPRNG